MTSLSGGSKLIWKLNVLFQSLLEAFVGALFSACLTVDYAGGYRNMGFDYLSYFCKSIHVITDIYFTPVGCF